MSPDLEKLLQSRYPSLYRDLRGDPRSTGMAFGFEVGDGWYKLIDAVSALVVERATAAGLNPVASQIKEKFGTLRCHFQGFDNDEYLHGVVRMASSLSTRICEICGANGSLRGEGWFRVLCDEHERDYRTGGLQQCKTSQVVGAQLSNTDLTALLHCVIAFDVKHNDLEAVCVEVAGADDEAAGIRVEAPESCLRVVGMLALLAHFSDILVNTKGEQP